MTADGESRGTGGGLDVTFVVNGPVADEARDRARHVMEGLAARAPRPVTFARVKLRAEPQRPDDQQAIVQGTLDVSGAIIRAEATAATSIEAVDLLDARLARRLRDLTERREDANERPPSSPPGQWRHGDLPDVRPGFYARPPDEREIVRHKTYAPSKISIEEALFDLNALDFRFFLFTDDADGVTSIVYEEEDNVIVRRATGGEPLVERRLPVEVNPTPPAELSTDEAIEYLNLTDDPFVFYRDPDVGDVRVLYRRYDGHYGLVEPREGAG